MEKEVLENLSDENFEKKASHLKKLLKTIVEKQQELSNENITFVKAYKIYKGVFKNISKNYKDYFSSKQFIDETEKIETINKNWRRIKFFPEGRQQQAILEMSGAVARYLESVKNTAIRVMTGHYNNLDQAYLNTGYTSPNSELSISPLDNIQRGGNRDASNWYKNVKKAAIDINELEKDEFPKTDISFDENIINKIIDWIKNNIEQIESSSLIKILNKLTEIKNCINNWNNVKTDIDKYFTYLLSLFDDINIYFYDLKNTKNFDTNLVTIIEKLGVDSIIKNIEKIKSNMQGFSLENIAELEHIVNNVFDEIKKIYNYITENITNTINVINLQKKEKERIYNQNDDIRTFSYEEIVFDTIENYKYQNYSELLSKIDDILTNLKVQSNVKEAWNNFIKGYKKIEDINEQIINAVDKTISELQFSTNQYNISKSFKKNSDIYKIWQTIIDKADSTYGEFYGLLVDIDNITETNDLKESLNFAGETLLTFINDTLFKINNWSNIINNTTISYGSFIRQIKNDIIWIIDACVKNPIKGIDNYVKNKKNVSANVNNIIRILTGGWANFNTEEDLKASQNILKYNEHKKLEYEEKIKQNKIEEFKSYVSSILGNEFNENSILSIIIFIRSLNTKINTFDNETIKKLYNELRDSYEKYINDKDIENLKESFYNLVNFSGKSIRKAEIDFNSLDNSDVEEYNKRKTLVDGIKEYFILEIQQYFYNLDDLDIYTYDDIFDFINKKYRYVINTFDLDKKYYFDNDKNSLVNKFVEDFKQIIEIYEDKFVDKDDFEKSYIIEKIVKPLCNDVLNKLSELYISLEIKEAKNIANYRYGQFINIQQNVTRQQPIINPKYQNLSGKYEKKIEKNVNDKTTQFENKETLSIGLLNNYSNKYEIFLNNPVDNGFINVFFKGQTLEKTLGTTFDYKTKVINFTNNMYPKFLVDYKNILLNLKNQGVKVDLTIIDKVYATFLELRNIVKLFYIELSKKIETAEKNIEILENNMKNRTDKESEEYKQYEGKMSELQENLQKLYNTKQDEMGNNGWIEDAKRILQNCSKLLYDNIYNLQQQIGGKIK